MIWDQGTLTVTVIAVPERGGGLEERLGEMVEEEPLIPDADM